MRHQQTTDSTVRHAYNPALPAERRILTATYSDGSVYMTLEARKPGNKHWQTIDSGDSRRIEADMLRAGLTPEIVTGWTK